MFQPELSGRARPCTCTYPPTHPARRFPGWKLQMKEKFPGKTKAAGSVLPHCPSKAP